ncbi:MAG TPA: class I SAM-dependent methyltransferase [Acidimicrobiales bacterium]
MTSRLRRLVPVSRARYDALARARDELASAHQQALLEKNHIEHVFGSWVPPGHFYSPFPDVDEVEKRADTLFDASRDPAGIDLREDEQVALFETLAGFLEEDLPFPADKPAGEPAEGATRYYHDNPAYSWSDGMILHAMLRHIAPRRVVEVGSGYSSAMTLDTTERWLDGKVDLVFVEPYTELLRSLLRPGDEERVTIHESPVQDVPLSVFEELEAGDVLFVDSTHVVKAGSDVNHLVFEVFPRLAPGVWIHVHDIFFPFEYPLAWVREGRAWQEVYLLRAFLTGNDSFEIRWFQSLMWARHRDLLEGRLPAMAKNPGGNIWLQKVE